MLQVWHFVGEINFITLLHVHQMKYEYDMTLTCKEYLFIIILAL